jgi:hypothetical protein
MDGFKIAGSPGLSGIFPGKDYLSLFNNSFVGIFRCRYSDGAFFLINQDALNIPGITSVATGSRYNRVAKDLFTGKGTGSNSERSKRKIKMKYDMLMQQTDTKPRQKMKTLTTMGKPFVLDPPQ